ncbi:MAG: hypothetical protein U5K56_14945 [Halioglobus sp.]|nr:hypothetical protein [Halioglobus sp.]
MALGNRRYPSNGGAENRLFQPPLRILEVHLSLFERRFQLLVGLIIQLTAEFRNATPGPRQRTLVQINLHAPVRPAESTRWCRHRLSGE